MGSGTLVFCMKQISLLATFVTLHGIFYIFDKISVVSLSDQFYSMSMMLQFGQILTKAD